MTRMMKLLMGGAGLAALAAAAPVSAQYSYPYSSYGYNNYGYTAPQSSYGYTSPYSGYTNRYSGYGYSNGYAMNTSAATQQCTAAVQSRLYNRTSLAGVLGSLVGIPQNQGRVLGITQTTMNGNTIVIRGLATSGRYSGYNNYGAYGVGAYGGLGYNTASQADLSFRCNVDPSGYVRSVHISRR
jgi:hypothetical protein